MPRVNPIEVLDAFAPFLTDTGGIKQAEKGQFQTLFNTMKNCSKKLVTKCIYCKILMATSPEVLEHLLQIGVWDMICLWLKLSKEVGNTNFLLDLLKLLYCLPMTIERLRENECPKIVQKLCKHENQDIAEKASAIKKKWKKLIEKTNVSSASQNGGTEAKSTTSSSSSTKEKKRKAEQTAVESSKKSKLSGPSIKTEGGVDKSDSNSNASTDSTTLVSDAEPYEAFPREDMNKFIVNKKEESKPAKPRPSTAKVKQGKFRLDLSAPSSTTAPGKAKKKTLADAKAVVEAKKTLPLSKTTTSSSNGTLSKAPVSAPIPMDSMSFMDALNVMPLVPKKRRKINKDSEGTATNKMSNSQERKAEQGSEPGASVSSSSLLSSYGSSSHDANNSLGGGGGLAQPLRADAPLAKESHSTMEAQKSPPRFSFYKDILEDTKSEEETSAVAAPESHKDDANTSVAASVEGELPDSAASPEPAEQPSAPTDGGDDLEQVAAAGSHRAPDGTLKPKSILCYIKKGSKKSVRWPEEGQLEQVKYFELDENERINVNRLSADMKRCDMKHEAQLMMEARRQPTCYGVWRLFPIIVDPSNQLVVRGCNSKERLIQAEKQSTTMECFYMLNMLPDSPAEPDLERPDIGEPTKVIPTEDENQTDQVQDYSAISHSPMQTDAQLPPPGNFDYGNNNVNSNLHFNPEMRGYSSNDSYPPMGASGYASNPNQPPPYQVPPASSMNNSNYMPPTSINFENPNPNYSYSSVNGGPGPSQPPMYPGNNMYPEYPPSNNSNFGGPPAPNPGSPPNMFNNPNQPPNFFNHQPPGTDGYSNGGFWPDGPNNHNSGPPPNSNYPPGGQFNMPPQQPPMPQPSGPRFFQGRGGRGGASKRFHKKGNDGICRFFAKTGRCKYESRCAFSHQVDNAKAARF